MNVSGLLPFAPLKDRSLHDVEAAASQRDDAAATYNKEVLDDMNKVELPGLSDREEEEEEQEGIDERKRYSYEYARSESRSRTNLSRHASAVTVLSQLRSRNVRSAFLHPLSHQKTSEDVLVDFDGLDDPYRPHNWEFKKKCVTTALYGFTTAGITFASAVYSAGVHQIAEEFHVGLEVSTSGISMMLFGFGLGPLLWAPLSEVYGRKPAVLAPYFLAAIFSFATATAKDIQTVLITRFFAGFFGSAPITNTGGVLGDIFTARTRGTAVAFYAAAVTGGPTLAPLIGGAVVQSYLGWRWTEYLSGILMMFILTLDLIFLDESFAPVLLVWKARRLRHETGNWALHCRHEEWDVSLRELAVKYLVRPFQMIATPICFLVALHASFVYGILYANLAAFPIEFQQVRGWNQVTGGLPFLAVLLGIIGGICLNIYSQGYYRRKFEENGKRALPEARLPPMMGGAIAFTIGLFLFAWTASPRIHWIAPVIGCAFIGFGFTTIFQQAINYLVDTFTKYGASAIAANTFLRSMFAGAFPLFINPMYDRLGVSWGSSVFGFVSALLIPVPFLFFIYGKRIRAKGKWSRESL